MALDGPRERPHHHRIGGPWPRANEVERRILSGQRALFPAVAAEWERLHVRLAALLDGGKAAAVPKASVRARASDLAKLSDSATYALVGEGAEALVYPEQQLRDASA